MPTKTQREAEFYLKDNGFSLHRETRHGIMWVDGISTIMVPKCPTPRGEMNLWADIRRALKKRENQKSAISEPVMAQEETKVVYRLPEQPAVVAELVPAQEEDEPMNKQPDPFKAPTQQPQPTQATGRQKMPLIVMTILTDPELTDTQKVKMLMAYIDL
jgi:hypothetical protein